MMSSEQNQGKPPPPQKVTFGRRTPSGRYISYSREDLENELGSVDFSNYHVQFPMTPDNQPMELMPVKPAVSAKAEEHYVSSSLFTGGFNSVTRAHLMDKVTNAGGGGPAAKASTCMVEGCDGKVMCDERGEELLPCECEFKICRDCFGDAVKNGDKLCPGCKEPYKATDAEEVARIAKERKAITVQRIPAAKAGARMERRLSMMRSIKGGAVGEFDHNRWLFETNGTYGYGNAIMPEEDDEEGCSHGEQRKEFVSKPWRPLTRKLKIPAAVLSPYSVCTTVILGGKEDISQEHSSGDTTSSSWPSNESFGYNGVTSKELRRRQIKDSDPIKQLSWECMLRDNLNACAAFHGESFFNAVMSMMHPSVVAQLQQVLKMA